jgi:AraC-like DNA-binding protein
MRHDQISDAIEPGFRVVVPRKLHGLRTVEVRGRRLLSRMYNDTYNLLTGPNGGDSVWVYRGSEYRRGPEEVALFEPGEVRVDRRIYGPLHYRVVCIEKSCLDSIFADSNSRQSNEGLHFRTVLAKDDHLIAALQALSSSVEDGGSSLLEMESCLSQLGAILRTHAEQPGHTFRNQESASIQKAYEMLIERCSEDLSLDDLATVAHLSRFHFISAFRKRYGLPPHAFQLSVRIAKARSYLSEGMSGTEVAHRLGFADHAHLIRQFKRWQGVSPRSFSKSCYRI